MQIQSVFFDFDGTLFDTRGDIINAYLQTFAKQGFPIAPEDFRIGPPMDECIRQAKPDITAEHLEATAAMFKEQYDNSGFPETKPYPGVSELLDQLADMGVPLYIATNKRMEPLIKILRKFGWEKRFSGLYSTDLLMPERRLSKIAMLKLAIERDALEPASCLMVGDTNGDIIGGRAAGMRTLGATWGYAEENELAAAGPDGFVHKPDEVLNYIAQAPRTC